MSRKDIADGRRDFLMRMDEDLIAWVDAEALRLERSRAWVITHAVRMWRTRLERERATRRKRTR